MGNSDDRPAGSKDAPSLNLGGADASLSVTPQPSLILPSEGMPERPTNVTIAPESDAAIEDASLLPLPVGSPRPKPTPRFSARLADRPLWQIVSGLGLGAIGLTGVAIGLFTLSGLALQGMGRAVASLIAGAIVLALFSGIPVLLAVLTLQTNRAIRHQGVSANTAKLALGIAIAIGVVGGVCGRWLS
jgi:hypothetical protein